MSNIFKKLKNWTFDVLGFVFFVLLEMFLYLIEVIDFFAKIRRPPSSNSTKKGATMQNRYVNGWYVTCWYCKNTVDANRVKCPYCGAWLFLMPQDYEELREEGIKP